MPNLESLPPVVLAMVAQHLNLQSALSLEIVFRNNTRSSPLRLPYHALKPRLDSLPAEILSGIAQYLDLKSAISLQIASRGTSLFTLSKLPRHTISQFLCEIEKYKQNDGLYACHYCHKLLPKASFGDSQWKKKGKWACPKNLKKRVAYEQRKVTRACLDCAAKRKLYQHWSSFGVRCGKRIYGFCHVCCTYSTAFRCGIPGDPYNTDYEHAAWKCWSPPTRGILALPADLLGRVVERLSHPDAICLSMTCTQMQQNVNLGDVPAWKRVVHVLWTYAVRSRMARDIGSLYSIDFFMGDAQPFIGFNRKIYPCFCCFRVRDSKDFFKQDIAAFQAPSSPWWKMKCRACSRRLHASIPGHSLVPLQQYYDLVQCPGCLLVGMKNPVGACFMCLCFDQIDSEIFAQATAAGVDMSDMDFHVSVSSGEWDWGRWTQMALMQSQTPRDIIR